MAKPKSASATKVSPKSPRVKKPKFVLIETPGKQCPNCGLKYQRPTTNKTFAWYDTYNDVPHENPFDCIRALRSEIEDVRGIIAGILDDIRP